MGNSPVKYIVSSNLYGLISTRPDAAPLEGVPYVCDDAPTRHPWKGCPTCPTSPPDAAPLQGVPYVR